MIGATTLVPTGVSSVSVSLEDVITWRLPGFFVDLWDEAISENAEEDDDGLEVV